jgi:UDP-3-O-[3-hydroxymyristoyl] glucosamine N-acyltransferase
MPMNLYEIAQKLGCRLDGPGEAPIHGIAGIELAEPGQITFLANRRYFHLLKTTRASAVLVEDGINIERDPSMPRLTALRTANPYLAFAHAIELFYQAPRYAPGFHPTALIAKSAKIGTGAHIGPYCVVGEDAHIGRNAVLHSFVTIYQGARIGDEFFAHSHAVVREFCHIGDRVILQNGAIIGGDGLGQTRASTAPRSEKRASVAAPSWTTWSSSAMPPALGPTPCCADRSASQDPPKSATAAFSQAR